MNNRYAKAYTEVVSILETLSEEEYSKIPKEKIEFYKEHRDVNYQYQYDAAQLPTEQNISREANAIIVSLFRDYFATESQKETLQQILLLNERKHQEELREKYSVDDIFKNSKCNTNTKKKNNKIIMPKKQTLLDKIIGKLKSIFYKN